MQTAKDKALYCNTLIGIIKACEGKYTQIDLRNEMQLYGKVESVESNMSVIMSNAFLTMPFSKILSTSKDQQLKPKHYTEITVRGRNIRFVHIPDDVDMIEALQQHILMARSSFNRNVVKVKNTNKKKFVTQEK
jgi:small nuclear ribonucleoprotein (snRNP)-like protein